MRNRNEAPKQANDKEVSHTSDVSPVGDTLEVLSADAQLEKMRPKDLVSWLEFRVRLL